MKTVLMVNLIKNCSCVHIQVCPSTLKLGKLRGQQAFSVEKLKVMQKIKKKLEEK